jgi:hypothetical protein
MKENTLPKCRDRMGLLFIPVAFPLGLEGCIAGLRTLMAHPGVGAIALQLAKTRQAYIDDLKSSGKMASRRDVGYFYAFINYALEKDIAIHALGQRHAAPGGPSVKLYAALSEIYAQHGQSAYVCSKETGDSLRSITVMND